MMYSFLLLHLQCLRFFSSISCLLFLKFVSVVLVHIPMVFHFHNSFSSCLDYWFYFHYLFLNSFTHFIKLLFVFSWLSFRDLFISPNFFCLCFPGFSKGSIYFFCKYLYYLHLIAFRVFFMCFRILWWNIQSLLRSDS